MPRVLLEVAVASVEDALTAQHNGADRVELSSGLAVGGLTPSLGLVAEVAAAVTLPVIVLARPRPGGFCYTASEFRVLLRDVELLLAHPIAGVAFGILTAHGDIDRDRCRQAMALLDGRQAVFHRAFDVTPDPHAALEQLRDLGVTRVMTSGQEETAYHGTSRIAQLVEQAAGRIEVLPAGGVNRFTVADVVARTGCTQVHASLRATRADRSTAARPHVRFGSLVVPPEDRYDATSPDAVRELRTLLGGP